MTDIINHPAHYTGVTAEIECIEKALWYLEDSIKNGYNNLDLCDKLAPELASIATRNDKSPRGNILYHIATYRIVSAANILREMIRDREASK